MNIPTFPKFKSIDVTDKDWVEKVTSSYPPFSDFNFTSLHCWNTDDQTTISMLNSNLIIRMKDYISNDTIYSVIGHHEINKTVEFLLNFPEIKKLTLVPETNFQTEKEIFKNFSLEEDRNQFDYIYDLEELSKFEGSKYHNKRNLAKRFERENKSSTKIYTSFNKNVHKQIIDLTHIWAKKKNKLKADFEDELKALEKTAEIMHVSKIIVMGLFVNKKLIGFTISELLQNGYCMIHFEKTDPDFPGVSEYLMKKTTEHLKKKNARYLDFQQDLGIEGLRRSKMSYQPIKFLKKYTVKRK